MSQSRSFIYDVPKHISFVQAYSRLTENLHVRSLGSERLERVFLDTHDWRLYHAGRVLELAKFKSAPRLLWRSLGNFEIYSDHSIDQAPRFSWDITDRFFRHQLHEIIGIRALLPRIMLSSRVHQFAVLDGEDKTLLRIRLLEDDIKNSKSSKAKCIGRWVYLLPVRGYDSHADKIAKALINKLGFSPSAHDPLVSAAEFSETPLGRTKHEPEIEESQRTDAAAKIILKGLLDVMVENKEGMLRDLDSEFLHDFRVAVRRTRALLGQVKGIFPSQRVGRFKKEFAWLGKASNTTRDMDVYLLNFNEYQQRLPSGLKPALAPLHRFLEIHKDRERHKLVAAIKSARYQRLLKDWRGFLELPVPERSNLLNAMRPVSAVANERIWKLYRHIRKRGLDIKSNTPAQALHDLRIECKKLRYLLEFFRSLYPNKDMKILIKSLKQLQDNLGDFNDLDVQKNSLQGFLKDMREEMKIEEDTERAMKLLVEDLEKRHLRVRIIFSKTFKQFASKQHHAQFKSLFGRASKVCT